MSVQRAVRPDWLHGNPTWSLLYRHLIGLLRDRFRCVALDYPGFGLSVAAQGYDHLPESHLAVDRPVLLCWGAGHYVQAESPAEIAAAIQASWPEQLEGRA